MVRDRHGKYYLPVDKNKNISKTNGGGSKKRGTTTWDAVRILQGPNNPQIDITEFTFATSKGTKTMFRSIWGHRLRVIIIMT